MNRHAGRFWDPHPSDDGILDVTSVDVPVPMLTSG